MITSLRIESLVAGLGLVGLGVVWLLANLGRVDLLASLRLLWPSLLLVWGLLELGAWGRARAQRRHP